MALLNFRSTSYLKAFILYAFISAIAAALAVEVRVTLENKNSKLFNYMNNITPEPGVSSINKIIITIIMTFFIYIFVTHIMYFVFGWGDELLVSKNKIRNNYL
jgi:hypothetical protein